MLVTEYMEVDGETPSRESAGCTKLLAITPFTVSALTVYRLCQGWEGQGIKSSQVKSRLCPGEEGPGEEGPWGGRAMGRDAMRDAIREAP